jgi:tetratricopeptide (TPR) repeat protein
LYRKALAIDPDYSLANNNLAYLMLQHGGNVDVALSLAQTARLRMPEDPHVADTLAWAYCQKGAYATAIELLKQALQKAPDDATYHYHIGLAYDKADHKVQAREHFKRAVALNPSYAKPLRSKGRKLISVFTDHSPARIRQLDLSGFQSGIEGCTTRNAPGVRAFT